MKTANLFRLAFFAIALAGLTLSGCKKDKTGNPADDSSSLQQLATDEDSFDRTVDESMNDIDQFLNQGNLKETNQLPCNATIDSTIVANDSVTIFITYNGLNCAQNLFRTGHVVIRHQVGQHWYEQGATVRIRHINFTVTRVATGKTTVINSIKTHKNVSGGVIWQLGNGISSVVQRTWGHADVSFQDGTSRTWNIARQRTYTGTPDSLVLTIDGFGTAGGFDNLVVWGLNRQGDEFYTQILQPVVFRKACGWDPCTGIKKHQIPSASKSATQTFGYDSNNQPVTGNECPTKFRLDWVHNNNSGTVYIWL
ncbi:MAG TPA: hypothetical protein PKG48_04170 [Bacteroidales bacterium]|nr:hypothetical protein [Bacteroidales bacterium]HPS62291.1 hypothetical protein [Bacteroidales bacterium]